MRTLQGHRQAVRTLAFAPDGRTLASGGDDRGAKLWDLGGGAARMLKGHGGRVYAVAYTPDAAVLATGCGRPVLRLWDVASGRLVGTADEPQFGVGALAYSPDGALLASANRQLGGANTVIAGNTKFWSRDPASGALREHAELTQRLRDVFRPERRRSGIWSLAFAPNATRLSFGTDDWGVRTWDYSSGELQPVGRLSVAVHSLSYSPDGRRLAATVKSDVVLWDFATPGAPPGRRGGRTPVGPAAVTLRGHQGRTLSVAFSPDGRLVASAGEDGSVRFWDVNTGREVAVFDWKIGKVYCVAFAPDGLTAACGGESGAVVLWDVDA